MPYRCPRTALLTSGINNVYLYNPNLIELMTVNTLLECIRRIPIGRPIYQLAILFLMNICFLSIHSPKRLNTLGGKL